MTTFVGGLAVTTHLAGSQPPHALNSPKKTAYVSDFAPHWTKRREDSEASRSEHRKPLVHHRPEAKPKPTDITMPSDPRAIGRLMVAKQGWGSGEFSCLDALWTRESGWNPSATNTSSGAYGIPQALPAEKMATFGSDYRTNAITQMAWGLWYIRTAYGTPCGALGHSDNYGWY